jgi:predicted MFS family arabinose efflux permease
LMRVEELFLRARTPSPRLGAEFTKLWGASAVSNIGDGVMIGAAPLLTSSLTTDPTLVSGAAFAGALPWLLFSLFSGVYADRLDRQRVIVVVNVVRGLVVTALAVTVLTGVVSIPIIYVSTFLLCTCETLADTAAASYVPSVVPRDQLQTANTRLMATFTVGNMFVAKPLGAYLFVAAAALPFGFNALTFFIAAIFIALMKKVPVTVPQQPRRGVLAEAAEGVRWLFRHRLLWAIAVAMGLGNLMFAAAFAVFVLYARQRLGVSEVQYGFLLTAFAAGGLLGTAVAGRLRNRFGTAALLRTGLLIEAATHLVLASTTQPLVAAGAIVVFSVHSMVWGVIVVTLRQHLVPDHLLGRVTSVHALFDATGFAVGAPLGGLLADRLGIAAPYWFAGCTMVLIALISWRSLGQAADGVRENR